MHAPIDYLAKGTSYLIVESHEGIPIHVQSVEIKSGMTVDDIVTQLRVNLSQMKRIRSSDEKYVAYTLLTPQGERYEI